MGSGTAQDPLRITNADDLISLDDPDIGLAGYHFVQTDDIDCAALSHWPSFEFKGNYNGNGKTIRNVPMRNGRYYLGNNYVYSVTSLFVSLQATSSVTNLHLENCSLAVFAAGCNIKHCRANGAYLLGRTSDNTQLIDCQVTGGYLVAGEVENTQITGCQVTGGGLVGGGAASSQITGCQVTGGGLVEGNAESSQITGCQVMDGQSLVWGQARKTNISDCAVLATWSPRNINNYQGLIANILENGSVVERCFVAGSFSETNSDIYFSGIAGKCESSTIRQCAVGSLNLSLRYHNQRVRITYGGSSATLQNNASIDTNPGNDDSNGQDGKTVAAARFNQRFFEGNLGWDFDTVWQWDAANNRPALRFDADASQATDPVATNTTAANGAPLQDLLTRQVQANIWL